MAKYLYTCSNKKCDISLFEIQKFMCESNTPELCPDCGHKADRDLASEWETQVHIPPTHTLGSRRDKNSREFSDDYKRHLENENVVHNQKAERRIKPVK